MTPIIMLRFLMAASMVISSIVHANFRYTEPSYFQGYEDLLGPNFMKRCWKREFPPTPGNGCRELPKACLWGEQTCPVGVEGDIIEQPTVRCDCRDREWTCQDFACPTIPPLCPTDNPSEMNPPPICRTDLTCNYGDDEDMMQSCCGRSFPKSQCVCTAGSSFQCVDVNICSIRDLDCTQVLDDIDQISLVDLLEKLTGDMGRSNTGEDDKREPGIGSPDPAPDGGAVPELGELSCPVAALTGDDCSTSFASCEYDQQCCPDDSQCVALTECICGEDDTFTCNTVPLTCDNVTIDVKPEPDSSLPEPNEEEASMANQLNCPVMAQTGDDCTGSFDVCGYDQQCCPDGTLCVALTECVCGQDMIFTCNEVALNCDDVIIDEPDPVRTGPSEPDPVRTGPSEPLGPPRALLRKKQGAL